ncbi:hypothetical protein [uncultured Bradyrhizobium sp.]|jgi:hypothetical protein|uniref:hypothetical protein n=1 Tax=uncultured Bradyrhizobium sp. TaxID=199684 RepID=UPI00262104F9|nr:hypothetical protein [uncultured Bradyrhizobium sp.]
MISLLCNTSARAIFALVNDLAARVWCARLRSVCRSALPKFPECHDGGHAAKSAAGSGLACALSVVVRFTRRGAQMRKGVTSAAQSMIIMIMS